jgi:hypothetical protein
LDRIAFAARIFQINNDKYCGSAREKIAAFDKSAVGRRAARRGDFAFVSEPAGFGRVDEKSVARHRNRQHADLDSFDFRTRFDKAKQNRFAPRGDDGGFFIGRIVSDFLRYLSHFESRQPLCGRRLCPLRLPVRFNQSHRLVSGRSAAGYESDVFRRDRAIRASQINRQIRLSDLVIRFAERRRRLFYALSHLLIFACARGVKMLYFSR